MKDQDDIPLRDALEQYIDAGQGTLNAHTLTSKRNLLDHWIDWLREEHDVTSTGDLEHPHLAEYADADPTLRRLTVVSRAMSVCRFIRFLDDAGFVTDEQMMELRLAYRETKA